MANARLEQEKSANRLECMVPIDFNDIVIFGKNNKFSIATDRINSCHAVAIVSRKAAILAHIAPMSPNIPEKGSANPRILYPTGDLRIDQKLKEVMQRLKDNRQYFENADPGSVVVYGLRDNQCALPDQVDRIASVVQTIIRRDVKRVSYPIDMSKVDWKMTNKVVVLVQGTVVGQLPNVWVENQKLELPQSTSSRATVTASASTSNK